MTNTFKFCLLLQQIVSGFTAHKKEYYVVLLLLEKLPNTYTARIGTEIHVTYRICIDIHKAWLQNT